MTTNTAPSYTDGERKTLLAEYIENVFKNRSTELKQYNKLVSEIEQEEFDSEVAPALERCMRRSPDLTPLRHLMTKAYQLSWGCVLVNDGILICLIDLLTATNLEDSYYSILLLLSIISKSSSQRAKVMKYIVSDIKRRWSILPLPAVVVLASAANVLVGIDDASVIKTVIESLAPIAKTSSDVLARVSALAGYIMYTKYMQDTDAAYREIVKIFKECLAAPAHRMASLKLMLLLTEGAKTDCTPILMPAVAMEPVKMLDTHTLLVSGLLSFARQADGSNAGTVLQNLLHSLYIPVIPSPTLCSDFITMLYNADLDSKKTARTSLYDDLVVIINAGLDASGANASLQHTKRVEAAAASAVILRAHLQKEQTLTPALLRTTSSTSPLFSDNTISRTVDEDLYAMVSYIHAVYMCANLAPADTTSINPLPKDFYFAPFIDEFIKFAVETSSFVNKQQVFSSVFAMMKLHLRDLFTKETFNGAPRKSDIKTPVTFVKHCLHRMKSSDPLVNVSFVVSMLQLLQERYVPAASDANVLSDMLARRPVCNGAGVAAVGVLKDVLDKDASVHVSSAILLLLHHPGLLVTDSVKGAHENPNVYPVESVSAAVERVGMMSVCDIWSSLPECTDLVIKGLGNKNVTVSKHCRSLLASLLVHGEAPVVQTVMKELVKMLWSDVVNSAAIRNEHVIIWQGSADDIVNVDAYKAKTVTSINVKGRKEDDAEWEKMQEEAAKKQGKAPAKAEPKKQMTPKELAYRKEVLAGQATIRATVQNVLEEVTCHLSTLWQLYSHSIVLDQTLLRHSLLFLAPLRLLACSQVPVIASAAITTVYAAYDAYRIACHSPADSTYWRVIALTFLKAPYNLSPIFALETKCVSELPYKSEDKSCLRDGLGVALNKIILGNKTDTTCINDVVFLALAHAMYHYAKDETDYSNDAMKAVLVAADVHNTALSAKPLFGYHKDHKLTDVMTYLMAKLFIHMYAVGPVNLRPSIHKAITGALYDTGASAVACESVLECVVDNDEHVRVLCLDILKNLNKNSWNEIDNSRLVSSLYISCWDTEATIKSSARELYINVGAGGLDESFYTLLIPHMSSGIQYLKTTLPKAFGGAAVTLGDNKNGWLMDLFDFYSLPTSLVPAAVTLTSLYELMTKNDSVVSKARGSDPYHEAFPNDFSYASNLKSQLTAVPSIARANKQLSDILLGPIPGAPPVVLRPTDMPVFTSELEYIALILTEVAYLLTEADVETVYKYILNEGLSSPSAAVRDAMVSAGLTIIRIHTGGAADLAGHTPEDSNYLTPRDAYVVHNLGMIGNEVFVKKLSPLFKSCLQAASSAKDRTAEYRRQGTAILMGGLASCLPPTDPMVQQVLTQLTDALNTSEVGVQRCIADCFSTLAKNLSPEEQKAFIGRLMTIMQSDKSQYSRRGAAMGLAGVIKGIGLGMLKKYEVLEKLTGMLDLPLEGARESVMNCFEYLSRNFGAGFEPYVISLLPHMLNGYSDSSADVRKASESAANQIMSNLTGPGVRLILVPLLKAVDSDQWRTKSGAVVLLGSMSHCAPKQLGACLPQIVPKLVEVLADSHAKVEEAGRVALREIIDVIKNPEIQAIGSSLVKALENPTANLAGALDSLINTTFVHVIDAPSLALIAPILQHGLVDRSADNKKKAAQIASHLCGLTSPRDLLPYITQLEPHLRQLLYHTLPEIRTAASKALGTLVKQFGEAPFKDLVAWLINGLKSETSTTERMGAAQGLSEVLAALGNQYLAQIMPDIISNTLHAQSHIREGFIGLFVFLPDAYSEDFGKYVTDVFPSLLKGLADESEPVRNISMKAASGLVRKFSTVGIMSLIPNFEKGIFDSNWRIRVASVQLLGDFLYRIAGTSGKIQIDLNNDDDADAIGTEVNAQNIRNVLGNETRNTVFSTLYMARSDPQQVVRQEALHVWKTVVPNTPKTLKEILPRLIAMIIESLASDSNDRRSTASRSLGDLVKRLHERVLNDILPVLSEGLNSENPTIREGVCLGLSDVIVSASKQQIQENSDVLVSAVRLALCDSNAMVREAAARSFNVLFEAIGKTAVEAVVPPVLDLLERSDEYAEFALDGIRQLLVVSATVVLPLLIPRLLGEPVTVGHLIALGSLAKVSGPFFHPHLKSTLETLRSIYGANTGEISEATITASAHVASQVSLASLNSFLMSVSEGLKHENDRIRTAAGLQLHGFLERIIVAAAPQAGSATTGGTPRIDIEDHLDDIIHMCITLYADEASCDAGVKALTAAEPLIRKEAAYKLVEPLRNSLRLVTQTKLAKDGSWKLPACKNPNALATVLYILQNALTYGSPESREEAALAMSDFVHLTNKSEFQAYSRKFIGPAIKAASERLPPSAKIALFNAIIDIMAASPDTAKVFMSPLGNTCAKALAVAHPIVRSRAAYGLAQLAIISPRLAPLYSEIFGVMDKNADATTKEACINALTAVLANATTVTDEKTLERMYKIVLENLGEEDPALREAAGQLAGRGIRLWPGTTVVDSLLMMSSTLTPALKHGRARGLAWSLAWNNQGSMGADPYANRVADVTKALLNDIKDDKSPIRLAAITGFKFAVLTNNKNLSDTLKALVPDLGKSLRDESTDNRLAACTALKLLGKRMPEIASTFECLHAVVPNLLLCAKEKNMPVKIAAERALYYCLDAKRNDVVINYTKNEKEEQVARGTAEYFKRVLSHMSEEDSDELSDEIIQMNYELQ